MCSCPKLAPYLDRTYREELNDGKESSLPIESWTRHF